VQRGGEKEKLSKKKKGSAEEYDLGGGLAKSKAKGNDRTRNNRKKGLTVKVK